MKFSLQKCTGFMRSVLVRLRRDHILSHASSLAYSTLLSIVPFFIVIFSILSHFSVFNGVRQQLNSLLINNLAYNFASEIKANIDVFLTHVNQLDSFGVFFLFVFVVLLMLNITQSFNHIWRTSGRFRYSVGFFIHLAVLIVSPILLALLLLAYPYFSFLKVWVLHKSYLTWLLPVWAFIPSVVGVLLFTLFNYYLPNARVRFLAAVVAGVFTELAFFVAKTVFQFYLLHFNYNQLIYGALATIPLFLIWLFVAWCIILTGAVVCQLLSSGINEMNAP
jgi:membrane protein